MIQLAVNKGKTCSLSGYSSENNFVILQWHLHENAGGEGVLHVQGFGPKINRVYGVVCNFRKENFGERLWKMLRRTQENPKSYMNYSFTGSKSQYYPMRVTLSPDEKGKYRVQIPLCTPYNREYGASLKVAKENTPESLLLFLAACESWNGKSNPSGHEIIPVEKSKSIGQKYGKKYAEAISSMSYIPKEVLGSFIADASDYPKGVYITELEPVVQKTSYGISKATTANTTFPFRIGTTIIHLHLTDPHKNGQSIYTFHMEHYANYLYDLSKKEYTWDIFCPF